MVKFYAKRKPGMKRAKNGKYYYPSRKRAPRKAIKQTAKNQALALKITKKKPQTVIERPFGKSPVINNDQYAGSNAQTLSGVLTDSRHWSVFNPLFLPATQGQHEPNDREDMRIYAMNTQAEIELYFNKNNIDCCYVRVMYGYYRGLPNLNDSNLLDWGLMETLLPNHTARFDPAQGHTRQFKVLSDKTSLLVPKQLYDSNWSDDKQSKAEAIFGENPWSEGQEITNALWLPFKKKFNFKYNRQFTYQNSDADSIVGQNPFIAIGVFPCGDAPRFKSLPLAGSNTYDGTFTYTDAEGHVTNVKVTDTNNPSPALSFKTTTYFKDIM